MVDLVGGSRTWTLGELRQELVAMLAPDPAPSVHTIKKWSAEGVIPDSPTAVEAARAVAAELASGKRRLRGPRGDGVGRASSDLAAPVLDALQALHQAVAGLRDAGGGGVAKGGGAVAPDLLQAIRQLDDTRRHLLLQHDQVKQGASSLPGDHLQSRAPAGAFDYLEWQKLTMRLDRLEKKVDVIIERLCP